ncbi:hypothetical protein [Marilutibacter chinensis]|uniref:Uncharacterized protein n=1 Tax=Marilutibacter chinensis TaxID=2912247 RepID=A0ABS9HQV2_9GAMM|nr:hypothetical protein [Lysobacter chinensis]MCF7220978.1 hypothetical protein [Lysobacter chinensis]
MIFDQLFKQYRKRKLSFGSRWLHLHGKLFLGEPSKLGLERDEVGAGVYDSYYYIPSDRVPVCSTPESRKQWQLGQLNATQIRVASQPHISKGVSLALLTFTLACVALASAISNKSESSEAALLSPAESQKVTASSLISTLTGLVSGAKKEKEKAPLELSLTQCQQLTVAAAQGLSDFTNEQAAACNKYNPR